MACIFCLDALENIKNETLISIKSLLYTFENSCADYQQIIESNACVVIHIKEIELQNKYVNIYLQYFDIYVCRINILELIRMCLHITFKML